MQAQQHKDCCQTRTSTVLRSTHGGSARDAEAPDVLLEDLRSVEARRLVVHQGNRVPVGVTPRSSQALYARGPEENGVAKDSVILPTHRAAPRSSRSYREVDGMRAEVREGGRTFPNVDCSPISTGGPPCGGRVGRSRDDDDRRFPTHGEGLLVAQGNAGRHRGCAPVPVVKGCGKRAAHTLICS